MSDCYRRAVAGAPVFADRTGPCKPPGSLDQVRFWLRLVARGERPTYVAPQRAARRQIAMMVSGRSVLCVSAAVSAVAVALAGGIGLRQATALTPADELASHRAVYELKLAQTRGNSPAMSARGRILYDFNGNACDGYSLQFRQVSELDSGEGKVSTSDLRSTTWEGGDAKNFKFTSENFVNQNLVDTVDGRAEHGTSATAVSLVKPKERALDIDASVVFPTEHMVRVIEAARAGK